MFVTAADTPDPPSGFWWNLCNTEECFSNQMTLWIRKNHIPVQYRCWWWKSAVTRQNRELLFCFSGPDRRWCLQSPEYFRLFSHNHGIWNSGFSTWVSLGDMFHQLACSRLITLFYFLNILLLSLSLLGLVFFVLWALPWRLCLGDTAWALAWRLCLGDIYMDSFKKMNILINDKKRRSVMIYII